MEAATDPPPGRRSRKRRRETQDHTTAAAAAASSTSILDLPNQITCDIISRLPIKSIFSSKVICPRFRNLTLEPGFPQLHFSRSPLSLILFRRSKNDKPTTFGILPLDDLDSRRSAMKFETQFESSGDNRLTIVNSCNGLICLANNHYHNIVYVCDPITRQHFRLPEFQNLVINENLSFRFGYGFGYCRSNDLFKVVKFTTEPFGLSLDCCVYTLGVDDEWRTLGNTGQPIPRRHNFVFLNGALHWIGWKDSKLLLCYFNIEKEQCGNLSAVPCQIAEMPLGRFHLGIVDNCLYVRDEQIPPLPVNICVMKDYGNIVSWDVAWAIARPLPLGLDLKPVKTLEDGRVMMIVKQKVLVSYDLVTRVFQRLSYQGVGFWEESTADVPSFLPLPGAV
ncbi:hypothetical protein Vadar_034363 [Vaccinium darrowii]|uniref:Uncharacterized protein n=1 Tax=Vaccinium darrowii TaxID=229202 RepID=A0ACB7XVG3_9ERIC|nr:hypothetical protein Vadar_034363 [Vaccinium darrowii]